jgi:hypothetical protein
MCSSSFTIQDGESSLSYISSTHLRSVLNFSIDNQSPPSSPFYSQVGIPVIINKVTARSQKKNPQYCLMPEEWTLVQNNLQQILVFCTFGALPTTHHGVCKGLIFTSGVKCTIDSLLGAALPIAMSGAQLLFVPQLQNLVIQIEDVLSLNSTLICEWIWILKSSSVVCCGT